MYYNGGHTILYLTTLFSLEHSVLFHCLAYDASLDSFLDHHGQVLVDVFFLFLDTAIYMYL